MDFKGEKINITEEIIITSRPIFENTIINIYKSVKKSNQDIEYLLREFQLELRNIKKWKKGEIKQANYKLKRIVGFNALLESLYKLNKKIFHISELDFKFDESLGIIDDFFKDVCLQIARNLWTQPHIIYEIYDNKMYNKFQHIFEKLIRDSIIFVLRRKARDDLTWNDVEKNEDEIVNNKNINPNIPFDIIDEIEDNFSSHSSSHSSSDKSSISSSEKTDGDEDCGQNIGREVECKVVDNNVECVLKCNVVDKKIESEIECNVVDKKIESEIECNVVDKKIDKGINQVNQVNQVNDKIAMIKVIDIIDDEENKINKKTYKIKRSNMHDYSKYNYLTRK
jgi:hypothetical protein